MRLKRILLNKSVRTYDNLYGEIRLPLYLPPSVRYIVTTSTDIVYGAVGIPNYPGLSLRVKLLVTELMCVT